MRDVFPAINAAAVSLAERPCESGVQYTPCARKIIDERYEDVTAPTRSNRKDNESIHVWVSKCVRSAFKTVKRHYGFSTDHDTLIFLITEEYNRIEKAAHSAGTETDGKIEQVNCDFIT